MTTRPAGVPRAAGSSAPPRVDGRSTRWTQHRTTRRAELVDATLRAIRRNGAGVGMDEIAAAAGTSKTVLYRHFADRNELYLAVTEAVHARILRDLQASFETVGGVRGGALGGAPSHADPRAAIAAVVDAYLHLVEADPEVYRFVVTRPLVDRPVDVDRAVDVALPVDVARPVDVDRAVDDPNTGLVTLIGDQVAAVLADHGVDRSVAGTWGHALVGMVRAAADHWVDSPDPVPRPELVRQLTDLAWGGLGRHHGDYDPVPQEGR